MTKTAPLPPAARLLPPPARRAQPDFSLATVNIVLLLVLFFLVAGPIVAENEQGVALPETVDLPLSDLPRPLIVLLPDGGTALDGEVMALAEIAARLADNGAPNAYLLTARDTPAQRLLEALAVLEPAGISTSLVTLRNRALRVEPLAEVLP
jgi:biopolymer transport protein ExbD